MWNVHLLTAVVWIVFSAIFCSPFGIPCTIHTATIISYLPHSILMVSLSIAFSSNPNMRMKMIKRIRVDNIIRAIECWSDVVFSLLCHFALSDSDQLLQCEHQCAIFFRHTRTHGHAHISYIISCEFSQCISINVIWRYKWLFVNCIRVENDGGRASRVLCMRCIIIMESDTTLLTTQWHLSTIWIVRLQIYFIWLIYAFIIINAHRLSSTHILLLILKHLFAHAIK